MPTTNKNSKEWAQFQQNLKKTAFGVKFGKRLFTDPSKFTSKDLLQICKYLGLDLPKEVQLTADVVQAWASGAAVVSAIREGYDYKDAVKPAAAGFRLCTNLAEDRGYINADSASVLRTGVSVACIYASGGADVSAWISAGMELGGQSEIVKARAQMQAVSAASGKYQEYMTIHKANVAESIKKLQNGEIGIFGFLVDFASRGALLWENSIMQNPQFEALREKLPGLNFLPKGEWKFRGSSSASTWYGDTKSADFEISVQALAQMPREKAFDTFFSYVVEPFGWSYLNSDKEYQKMGLASLFDTAILALFDPKLKIDKNTSVLDALLKAQLTPSEIGVENTFINYKESSKIFSQAISTNFGASVQRKTYTREEMILLDQAGSIDKLSEVRESQDLINQKFNYSVLKTEAFEQNFNWRNFGNFLSVLDALDLIYSDPMYKSWIVESSKLKEYEVFPKLNNFKAKYYELWNRSTIRKVNTLALGNVAYFLNSNNIVLKNPGVEGPAVYGYK